MEKTDYEQEKIETFTLTKPSMEETDFQQEKIETLKPLQ